MGKVLEYNATLTARHDYSEMLALFTIQPDEPLPEKSGAVFIPGQYMTLGLNNEQKPELGSVRRPMSIASPPQQRDKFDFYVRLVGKPESDNPLTPLMWQLKAGDRMYVRPAAAGRFTVEDTVGADDPRLRVYVAAGTGLAPFTSMVLAHAQRDPTARLDRHAILHGASYPHELGYRDDLHGLAQRSGLRYLPTVSRPQASPGWTGDSGRVEDFFRAERLEKTERDLGLEPGGLNPGNAVIFICGLNGTIQQTVERLLPRGFIPDNRKIKRALDQVDATPGVFYEQYDNDPIIDVKDEVEVARLKALLPST